MSKALFYATRRRLRHISSLHVAFHLVCVVIRECHDTTPVNKATLRGPKRVSHEEMVMGI